MKVKCINPKSYNLTLNKEYEVIESDNYYHLLNDVSRNSVYSKDLFEVVDTVLEEIIVAQERQLLVSYNEYRNSITVDGVTIELALNVRESAISCGIYQYAGINSTITSIMYNSYVFELSHEKVVEIFKEYFKRFVMKNSLRFALVSTNLTDNDAIIRVIMDVFGEPDKTGNNPNSGNDIGIWILDIDTIRSW